MGQLRRGNSYDHDRAMHAEKLRGSHKHNPEGRRAHLHGRTGRRRRYKLDDREDMWEVEGGTRPQPGVVGYGAGGVASGRYVSKTCNQVVTAVEEHLFNPHDEQPIKVTSTPTKLSKNNTWSEVIEMLERNAVVETTKPMHVRGYRGGHGVHRTVGTVKHYYLEPTGVIQRKNTRTSSSAVPELPPQSKHSRFRRHVQVDTFTVDGTIYFEPDTRSIKAKDLQADPCCKVQQDGSERFYPRPTKVFAKCAMLPPATVQHPRLPGKMTEHPNRTRGRSRRGLQHWVSHTLDRHSTCRSGWRAARLDSCLEVDLGQDCVISDISTQGEKPETRLYPDHHMAYTAFNQPPYHGDRYMVVHPYATLSTHWVDKFELLVRVEGGRSWEKLGIFKGNTDCCTEVAHSLRILAGQAHPDGIVARYVRFRPISGEGMRVAVYGRPLKRKPSATDVDRNEQKKKAERLQEELGLTAREAETATNLVHYKVVLPNPNLNRQFTSAADGTEGGSWGWKDPEKPKRSEKKKAFRAIYKE